MFTGSSGVSKSPLNTRHESKKRLRSLRLKNGRNYITGWQSRAVNPHSLPTFVPYGMCSKSLENIALRVRIEEIEKRLKEKSLKHVCPSELREASPDPVFNQFGKRTNRREDLLKEKLNREKSKLIKRCQIASSFFLPQTLPQFTELRKFKKKMYVPTNTSIPPTKFIGLIIGPRGDTQKRLESETGCKIAIRGSGSVRKGLKRKFYKPVGDEDEPLHVSITSSDEKKLEKACLLVGKLLTPVEDGINGFKQLQLLLLADKNGTLYDNKKKDVKKFTSMTLTKQLMNYGKKTPLQKINSKPLKKRILSKHKNKHLESEFIKFTKELSSVSVSISENETSSFLENFYTKNEMSFLYPPGVDVDEINESEEFIVNFQEVNCHEDDEGNEIIEKEELTFLEALFPPGSLEEENYELYQRRNNALTKNVKEKKKKKSVISITKKESTVDELDEDEKPPWEI